MPCNSTCFIYGGFNFFIVFSFDSRGKNLEEGKHWSSEFLGERAFFRFQDEVAKLILNGVKESDAGIYHCRVDFRRSPTRNVVVNLTIISKLKNKSFL